MWIFKRGLGMQKYKKSKISLVLLPLLIISACSADVEKVEDRNIRIENEKKAATIAENQKTAKADLDEIKMSDNFHQNIFNDAQDKAEYLGVPISSQSDWRSFIQSENRVFHAINDKYASDNKTKSINLIVNKTYLSVAQSKLYTDGALKGPFKLDTLSKAEKSEILKGYESAQTVGFTGSKQEWDKKIIAKSEEYFSTIEGLSRIEQSKRSVAQELWNKAEIYKSSIDSLYEEYKKEGNYTVDLKTWIANKIKAQKLLQESEEAKASSEVVAQSSGTTTHSSGGHGNSFVSGMMGAMLYNSLTRPTNMDVNTRQSFTARSESSSGVSASNRSASTRYSATSNRSSVTRGGFSSSHGSAVSRGG
ncbi:hypothetical protein A7M79_00975 [Acinetobacter baumannii]|nr:hypothetical protein A7M79_00975 [Acinetobacter baumannii]